MEAAAGCLRNRAALLAKLNSEPELTQNKRELSRGSAVRECIDKCLPAILLFRILWFLCEFRAELWSSGLLYQMSFSCEQNVRDDFTLKGLF